MHIDIRRSCRALLGIAAIVSAGCATDPANLTNAERDSRALASEAQAAASSPERTALTELTRVLAIALSDDQTRARLKSDMSRTMLKEHKLEARRYLNGAILAQVAKSSGVSTSKIASLLSAVRPLEIYLPVASQRESWLGDANILVASQLEDSSAIVGFDTKGISVQLSRYSVPERPTISLVPVETRFDDLANSAQWTNVNDHDGKTIGTLIPCGQVCTPKLRTDLVKRYDCVSQTNRQPISATILIGAQGGGPSSTVDDPCGGGAGDALVSGPAGLYMTFSRIVDMGEPWTKGDPEIEVHVHGPLAGGDSHYGADLACSGEHAIGYRVFDQNNAFWNGSVLLWTKAESDAFNSEFFDGHNILFWEDDDTACTIKTDADILKNTLIAVIGTAGGAAVKVAGGGPVGVTLVIGTFLATLYQNADWLLSNDDFLGALVPASAHGDSWSDANFTLLNGGSINGRAQLVWKAQ